MGEHPVLAQTFGAAVGGRAVEPDRAGGGLGRGQAAGGKAGGHAGQHVPAAAPGKAGIAGGVPPQAAVGRSHDGAVPFEHNGAAPSPGVLRGHAGPVSFDLGHRKAGQAGHLPRVRGQNQAARRAGQRFTGGKQGRRGVQAVGVQHHGAGSPVHKGAHQRPRIGGIAHAGAHQQDAGLFPRGQQFRRRAGADAAVRPFRAGQQAAFGQAGRRRCDHRLDGRQGDDARTGPQGPFGGKVRRAPVAPAARGEQDMAVTALVALLRPRLDAGKDKIFAELFHPITPPAGYTGGSPARPRPLPRGTAGPRPAGLRAPE